MILLVVNSALSAANFMAGNLGIGLTDVILFILTLGTIVFMAADLRMGLIMGLITFAVILITFINLNLPASHAFTAFMLNFAILALSLWISTWKKSYGGVA